MEGLRGNGLLSSCLTGLLALGGAARAQDAGPEEIVWTAESWARTGNMYVFVEPRIQGGELAIEADEAVTTSLDLNTRWELSGSIVMTVGTARLTAGSAVFEFESRDLVAAELAGDPAVFEETEPEQDGPVRGEASRILYDSEAGTVQMQGSARFTMAQSSMSGCDFLYELDGGLVSGSNECGVPLSITYVPQDEGDAPEDGDEVEPGPAPGEAP